MGGGKGGGSGRALAAQVNLAREGLAMQQNQFDYIKDLMTPFVSGGESAFGQMGGLVGLGGSDEQTKAIQALENSPYFSGLVNQGEQALLANASATGGLRGGNTQAALAQFRPNMLQQAVQQQLANLSGITEYGLGAAGNITGASNQYSGAIGQAYGNMANAFAQRAQTKSSQSGGLAGSLGGLGQLAGGIASLKTAGAFSDQRLKSNIKRIGTHAKGFGLYVYNIFGRKEYGVLAQEVIKYVPDAVKKHSSGYYMVNYGVL